MSARAVPPRRAPRAPRASARRSQGSAAALARSSARGRPAARARGFTILEVVLAMAILFAGITAVLGFLSLGASLARTAERRAEAAGAIEAVVAELEETLFALPEGDPAGAAGPPAPVRDRPVEGVPGLTWSATATREPDPEPGRPPVYRVDVELAWSRAGVRRSRAFTALLIGEVPFGERLRRAFVAPPAAEPIPRPEGER